MGFNQEDIDDIKLAERVEDCYENNPEDFITYEQYRKKRGLKESE